jgi:hypothetical protein
MYYRLTYHNPDFEVDDYDSQSLRNLLARRVNFFWWFVHVKCPRMLREELFFAITTMYDQGIGVILTLPDQVKMTDEWLWRVVIEHEWVLDSDMLYRPMDLSNVRFEPISEAEFLSKLNSSLTSLIQMVSYDPLDQEWRWIRDNV